jgi:uncharacterized membrane protein YebE (DUF533 family)
MNNIPTWVFVLAGIVVGYIVYNWYKSKKKSTASSATATNSADAFTTSLTYLLAGGQG